MRRRRCSHPSRLSERPVLPMADDVAEDRRPRRLTTRSEIATIVGAFATILGVLVTITIAVWPSQDEPAGDTQGDGIGSPSAMVTTVAANECEVPDGQCDEAKVDDVIMECSVAGVLEAWGLDLRLDSLLLDVTGAGAECTVAPNAVSMAAGASADDIEAAKAGRIADVLRECARAAGRPIVPCSEPHEVEFVGGRFVVDPSSDTDADCATLGRKYAATNYGTAAAINFGVIDFPESASARCVLVVEHGLSTGSLRTPLR